MKEEIQRILDAFSSGSQREAESLCESTINTYQNAFMEALTVNTATDYIAVVILYCQITAKIKKPWRAVPKLEAVRGALRFIDDFMTDRETVASSYITVAESFAYAGFLPEAISYFHMSACITEDPALKENAFSQALYYSLRFGKIENELMESSQKAIGLELTKRLIFLAEEDLATQIKLDPVESSAEYLAIRYEIEKAVDEALESDCSNECFCLKYWRIKKKLLKDEFGISWMSPAEMNPDICFQ